MLSIIEALKSFLGSTPGLALVVIEIIKLFRDLIITNSANKRYAERVKEAHHGVKELRRNNNAFHIQKLLNNGNVTTTYGLRNGAKGSETDEPKPVDSESKSKR